MAGAGGKAMQQLTGLDASFLYFETANAPMHVGFIMIYDQSTAPGGRVTFRGILTNIEKRLHLARCFRERLAYVPLNLDHPYWIEDPDFDLEFHVRHIALPRPGDWRQLCIQVARLHSRPLDHNHPLWEVYVIEGLDNVPGLPKGSFAIVGKIHHAAIDGVTGAEILAALHDLEPGAEPTRAKEAWSPDVVPGTAELLGRTMFNNIIYPFRLGRVMGESAPAMARLRQELQAREFKTPAPVPRTRFNGTVTAHRVLDGRSFDLDAIRAMKSAVKGATVNDVVLAICGGSLREYLLSKRELPRESLLAMAPISVRTMAQRGTGGNQVSAMVVPLHTEIGDPLERLNAVHEGAVQSKALTQAVGARMLTDYGQFVPSALAGLAARMYTRLNLANRVNPFFNTVVTNVPGPQKPLYFCGARMVTTYGMGPIGDGLGLIHPVFSYCGQITIAATSCRKQMPDPAFYAQCLQNSFDEMKAATLGGSKVGKPAEPGASPSEAAG
jgi:diacylglycerol O-acyltransferase / wax synthase